MYRKLYNFLLLIFILLLISCSHISNKKGNPSKSSSVITESSDSVITDGVRFYMNDSLEKIIILHKNSLQYSYLEIPNNLSPEFCTKCTFIHNDNQIIFRNESDISCRFITSINYDDQNKTLQKTLDNATLEIYDEMPESMFIKKFKIFTKQIYFSVDQLKYLQHFPYHGGHHNLFLKLDSIPTDIKQIISQKAIILKNRKEVFPKYFYDISISSGGKLVSSVLIQNDKEKIDKKINNYLGAFIANRKFEPAKFIGGEPVNTKFRLMISFESI